MGMHATISRCLLDGILADARRDAGRERCGLLLGHGAKIEHFRPAANVHPNPSRHFDLDPAVLLAAHREAREGGAQIVGHYHSHPTGEAAPSRADADAADADGRLWLIITSFDWQMWRACIGGDRYGRFQRVELDVVPDGSDTP